MENTRIYIEPPYTAYYSNKLFDRADKTLNRDGALEPFIRTYNDLQARNISIETADHLFNQKEDNFLKDSDNYYFSFGILDNLNKIADNNNNKITPKSFVILEPPVVKPYIYSKLPLLTKIFDTVYVHNTDGDGYDITNVDQRKLRKLYWPQPLNVVNKEYWGNQKRLNKIAVINGKHIPAINTNELYSQRIKVMASLAKYNLVDLYGMNWKFNLSKASLWYPYLKNYSTLMSIYRGSCVDKIETLSKYNFCLCFENMYMKGYITEKIFDCFYAGTIPIYWGAKDIEYLIPKQAYIDYRNYSDIDKLRDFLQSLSHQQLQQYREAGRDFLTSTEGLKYYNSIQNIIASSL